MLEVVDCPWRARPKVDQAHLGILCNASGTYGTLSTSGYLEMT